MPKEKIPKSYQAIPIPTCLIQMNGGGVQFYKQAPFWGVNFSLMRNARVVKFYDTEAAVYETGFITESPPPPSPPPGT